MEKAVLGIHFAQAMKLSVAYVENDFSLVPYCLIRTLSLPMAMVTENNKMTSGSLTCFVNILQQFVRGQDPHNVAGVRKRGLSKLLFRSP